MKIISPAFSNGNSIPPRYTCDGLDISPPLEISGVGKDVKSLVLVVDDPDSEGGNWVHWLVWNIAPDVTTIGEHITPARAVEGTTSFGKTGWGGPCPHNGSHRYFFRLFALDSKLKLGSNAKWSEIEIAMAGHILDRAELFGVYARENSQ